MTTADDSLESRTGGARVLVLLDVRNITAAQSRAYCNAEIDFGRLRELALGDGELVAAIAVDSLVKDGKGDTAAIFHRQLERSGFELSLQPKCPESPKQTGVDVEIAVIAMRFGVPRFCDRVVLISGDGDFAPLTRDLRERGVEVRVMSFRASMSRILRESVDAITILDDVPLVKMQQGDASKGVA